MEQRIGSVRAGEMTQGVIFAGATADHYKQCQLYGIVITARCDVAQSKVPLLNYLPIVRWEDWIARDGRLILCQRALSDRLETIKSALRDKKHSPDILSLHPAKKIVETFFPVTVNGKIDKTRERLDRVLGELEVLDKLLARPANESHTTQQIISTVRKNYENFTREVFSQKVAGYYFLPSVTNASGDGLGYVVLLRQVATLPTALSTAIGEGCDRDQYHALCSADSQCIGRLDLETSDFAYPVGKLRSPEIEHLMQTFSLLFGRIGIADYEQTYLNRLLAVTSIGNSK